MKDNGVFTTPMHWMLAKNWYYMYQHHNTPYTVALVSDLKTFTYHMSKICNEHMFSGLYKVIKQNPYKFTLCIRKKQILVHLNKILQVTTKPMSLQPLAPITKTKTPWHRILQQILVCMQHQTLQCSLVSIKICSTVISLSLWIHITHLLSLIISI